MLCVCINNSCWGIFNLAIKFVVFQFIFIYVYTQPLNEREPEVSTEEFKVISPKLHQSLRIGAEKAVADGKMTMADAKKYIWSGKS